MSPSPSNLRWWHLPSALGLDAPVVVSLWCFYLTGAFSPLLPICVWAIYLLDRIFDVRRCVDWSRATGRLRFGRNYFRAFCGLFLVCVAAGFYFLTEAESGIFRRGVVVLSGVLVYFALFVKPVIFRRKLPGKELGVGVVFGGGIWAATGAFTTSIAGISALVAFNCLVIGARETREDAANDPGGASQWWANIRRDLFVLGILMTAAFVWLGVPALVFAALLHLTLHDFAQKISADSVRALADYALILPALVAIAFSLT